MECRPSPASLLPRGDLLARRRACFSMRGLFQFLSSKKCSCACFSPTSEVAAVRRGVFVLWHAKKPESGASRPGGEKHVRVIELQASVAFSNVPSCSATHRGECEGDWNVRCDFRQ